MVVYSRSLTGLITRPLSVTIRRYDYRAAFEAKRSAVVLPPIRHFDAIVRETAQGDCQCQATRPVCAALFNVGGMLRDVVPPSKAGVTVSPIAAPSTAHALERHALKSCTIDH